LTYILDIVRIKKRNLQCTNGFRLEALFEPENYVCRDHIEGD